MTQPSKPGLNENDNGKLIEVLTRIDQSSLNCQRELKGCFIGHSVRGDVFNFGVGQHRHLKCTPCYLGSRIWKEGSVITESCTGMATMVLVCKDGDRGEIINSMGC